MKEPICSTKLWYKKRVFSFFIPVAGKIPNSQPNKKGLQKTL